MRDNFIIGRRDTVHIVLYQPIIDLCSLSARFGDVVLQERDLIVVTKTFEQVFEILFVDVLLLGWWLSLHYI